MNRLEIKVSKGTKICVAGDLHSNIKQYNKLLEKVEPNSKMWFVSVGDVLGKINDTKSEEEILGSLINLQEKNIGFMVQGNWELKALRKNKDELSKQLKWVSNQPQCISFNFDNGTILTVLHGGVTSKHKWDDLNNNNEIVYVKNVDAKTGDFIPLAWEMDKNGNKIKKLPLLGVPWGEKYDGRFGYIASGHSAQPDGIPKFYNYSCNLDSMCYATGILSAQVFSEGGLEDLIQIKGKPNVF